MTGKPFHHGNLRSVLLTHAEQTLRTDGLDALSLRELARQAGVSHGAPRRHFRDRQALLDALAELGFRRLTDALAGADDHGAAYEARFRAVARAFVDFAVAHAALLELMFTGKGDDPPGSLIEATERFYAVSSETVAEGHAAGYLRLPDPARAQLLLIATLQGIATLVAAGRLPATGIDVLLEDTAALFIRPSTDRPERPTRASGAARG